MAATRFDQLNIVSDDLDATVAFYRRLGVEFGESGVMRRTQR